MQEKDFPSTLHDVKASPFSKTYCLPEPTLWRSIIFFILWKGIWNICFLIPARVSSNSTQFEIIAQDFDRGAPTSVSMPLLRTDELWPLDISTDQNDRCVNRKWVKENLSHNWCRLRWRLPSYLMSMVVLCAFNSRKAQESLVRQWLSSEVMMLLSGMKPHCDAFRLLAISL